jgi:uncharacterized membrane-anchored protein
MTRASAKRASAKRVGKYLLVMILPLCVLLVRPLTPAAVLMYGEEIRLSTEPVDPRDLFRGDYVALRFSIEELPASLLSEADLEKLAAGYGAEEEFSGESSFVYILLAPDEDGVCRGVGIVFAPPAEGLYLRGRIMSIHHFGDTIQLDYGSGLKRFYVPENTGLELEQAAQKGQIIATVKVWKGRPVLRSLHELF